MRTWRRFSRSPSARSEAAYTGLGSSYATSWCKTGSTKGSISHSIRRCGNVNDQVLPTQYQRHHQPRVQPMLSETDLETLTCFVDGEQPPRQREAAQRLLNRSSEA